MNRAPGSAGTPSATARPPAASVPAWLLPDRLAVPEPPVAYFHRPSLAARCDPTRSRLTVLTAPGGFGKTTLLAAACRDAVARAVPVAWLALDREDGAGELDAYIAFAFRRAGLNMLRASSPAGVPGRHARTRLLLRGLASRTDPCVLALDGLERVDDPDAVDLIGYLLRNAPPCLHMAVACRDFPSGFDARAPLLDGDAQILTAEDLAFSRAEIAKFFDLALSREELAAIADESRGWPIALRIWRNAAGRRTAAESRVARDAVGTWIGGRFLEQFSEEERELVLDIGLFEWIDAALLEEVADGPGEWSRLTSLPGLAGLLEPAGRGAPGVHRLHPLLREHCTAHRRRHTPGRYREIHRRLAHAIAARGDAVHAMRHAAEARDPELAGRILLEAGGLWLGLREGRDRLVAADRYLSAGAVAASPRLAMARCVARIMDGRLAEARRIYDVADAVFPPAWSDANLAFDVYLTRGSLALYGCERPVAERARSFMDEVRRIAALAIAPAVVRGTMKLALCAHGNLYARFDVAVAAARRSRRILRGRSSYLAMLLDMHLGMIAVARGRIREALARYRSARRAARARFLKDPRFAANVEILTLELAMERGRTPGDRDPARFAREVYRQAPQLPYYAAASEVALAHVLDTEDANAAVSAADRMWEHARDEALPALERLLAALRVSLLVEAGRTGDAQGAWQAAGLPSTDADCLDLVGQTWREMEAVACARLRLLGERADKDPARRFATAIDALAKDRDLVRTRMRALALRIRLEHRTPGGDPRPHVTEYLRLYARTDYARPIIAAGKPGAAPIQRFLDAEPDGPLAPAAERLLATVRVPGSGVPRFGAREMAVLRRLATHQDKEIAAEIGLSYDGVRHHVRGIFRKLGVRRRADAVRRARALGVLAPAD